MVGIARQRFGPDIQMRPGGVGGVKFLQSAETCSRRPSAPVTQGCRSSEIDDEKALEDYPCTRNGRFFLFLFFLQSSSSFIPDRYTLVLHI